MNADFQTIQYSFIASKNTYALRIDFTAPVFRGFSPSQQKLKKCSHERRVIYILRKYYVKKSCPFLQTCHLGTLQSELRRSRFGHGSTAARHVVITDCTGKKKMHAVGMSSKGGTFI